MKSGKYTASLEVRKCLKNSAALKELKPYAQLVDNDLDNTGEYIVNSSVQGRSEAAATRLDNLNKSKNLKVSVRKELKQFLKAVLKHTNRLSRRCRTEDIDLLRRHNQWLKKMVKKVNNIFRELSTGRKVIVPPSV